MRRRTPGRRGSTPPTRPLTRRRRGRRSTRSSAPRRRAAWASTSRSRRRRRCGRSGPGVPPGTSSGFVGSWEPSAKEYGLFVQAVGKRYDGHYTPPGESAPLPAVRFWSIWNEPNYGAQLAPQAVDNSTVEVSPLLYRELLDAAWTALGQTGHARRQDPDRRGRAPRADDRRSAGELLGDGAVALHPRALLRGRLAASAAGDRRDRCAAARRRRRRPRRSRASTRGCSTPADSPSIRIRRGR